MRKKYRTFNLIVPFEISLDKVAEMFNLRNCLVDDLCGTSTYGREIVVWVPENQTSIDEPENKPGYFHGLQPTEEQQNRYDEIYNTRA